MSPKGVFQIHSGGYLCEADRKTGMARDREEISTLSVIFAMYFIEKGWRKVGKNVNIYHFW